MAFSREADGFFRLCALGVWQADNAIGITPRHVEFYNAIYSGTGPAPSALYWEVATGVADYDLFQPPAFFSAPAGLRPAEGDHAGPALHRPTHPASPALRRSGRSGQRGGGVLCQRLLRHTAGPVRAGRPQRRPPCPEGR